MMAKEWSEWDLLWHTGNNNLQGPHLYFENQQEMQGNNSNATNGVAAQYVQ